MELDPIPCQKDRSRIILGKLRQVVEKRPVGIALDVGPPALLPHPDYMCPRTAVLGARKRILAKCPKIDQVLLGQFAGFVRDWCNQHMIPLGRLTTSRYTIDEWLAKTNYTEKRKEELLRAYQSVLDTGGLVERDFHCDSFVKDEQYEGFKHSRTINSRSDKFKVMVGPLFKEIEEQLFALPCFIKKIPMTARMDHILSLLIPGGKIISTDFSSFECSFTKELMESCEFILYEYMVRGLAEGAEFIKNIRKAMLGTNVCLFKNWFRLEVEATRMSGEMCTSLGNGFTNLMLILFAAEKAGINVKGVVEGDDGLFSLSSYNNTVRRIMCKVFKDLGFNIKLLVHNSLSTASFCGMIFHQQDRALVADPIKYMTKFRSLPARYCRSRLSKLMLLYHVKGLSMLYQFPNCPILTSFASYILRCTKIYALGVDLVAFIRKHFRNEYEVQLYLEAVKSNAKCGEIGMSTRHLVQDLYKITVEHQLAIEKDLCQSNTFKFLTDAGFCRMIPSTWYHFRNFCAVYQDPKAVVPVYQVRMNFDNYTG